MRATLLPARLLWSAPTELAVAVVAMALFVAWLDSFDGPPLSAAVAAITAHSTPK